jgi:hypothetical protein
MSPSNGESIEWPDSSDTGFPLEILQDRLAPAQPHL